jgi:ABC-type nitrate/sulfonate/bicarbonate transport system permease component
VGLARAGFFLSLVLLWQLAWMWGLPHYILGPFEILQHFFTALGSEELYAHIGASLLRSVPGFVIGASLGIAFGLAAGVSRAFDLSGAEDSAAAALHALVRHR